MDPIAAAAALTNLGFLAEPDLPDHPGPAYLIVAMRDQPTLRHFDPERVEYWVSDGGRGQKAVLTRATRTPLEVAFSWGPIRIVDRLGISNEYLSFGGDLSAVQVDERTIGVFTSPAPLLRRGGHSQGWDVGALDLGAFFGRLMVAVDYAPGFEGQVASSSAIARYAAFVIDATERYRGSRQLREARADLWRILDAEDARLRRDHPDDWTRGRALRIAAGIAGGGGATA